MSTLSQDQQMNISSKSGRVSKIWWVFIPAALVATVANIVFYYFLREVLNFSLIIPGEAESTMPLSVGNVVFMSVVFSVGAGIVFLILSVYSAQPIQRFVIVSAVVLVLSFALPLMLPSDKVETETRLSLMAMHVIGAILVVGIIIRLSRDRLTGD